MLMTAILPNTPKKKIVYPAGDCTPVAETYDHLYALFVTLEVVTPVFTREASHGLR